MPVLITCWEKCIAVWVKLLHQLAATAGQICSPIEDEDKSVTQAPQDVPAKTFWEGEAINLPDSEMQYIPLYIGLCREDSTVGLCIGQIHRECRSVGR